VALAAKHSWWEETWRWEIALRVLVLSGGQRLETAFIFWCVVFLACAGSRSPSSYDRCLHTLISALEGGIRSSVHLRAKCLGRNLAVSPSPRAHTLKFAAIVALRLNNVTAQRSTHSAGSASIAWSTGRAQHSLGASGLGMVASALMPAGWSVIDR
jgi:hypothetical protein